MVAHVSCCCCFISCQISSFCSSRRLGSSKLFISHCLMIVVCNESHTSSGNRLNYWGALMCCCCKWKIHFSDFLVAVWGLVNQVFTQPVLNPLCFLLIELHLHLVWQKLLFCQNSRVIVSAPIILLPLLCWVKSVLEDSFLSWNLPNMFSTLTKCFKPLKIHGFQLNMYREH